MALNEQCCFVKFTQDPVTNSEIKEVKSSLDWGHIDASVHASPPSGNCL